MTTKIVTLLVAAVAAFVSFTTPSSQPATTVAATTVDAVHSSIVFRVKHMDTAYFYGRFNKMSGELLLEEKDGSVMFEIDADSIDSNNVDRDKHLKSQDFLGVKEFPKITFKSKTVAKKGEDWEAAGDVTMHGQTKPLTVTIKPTGSSDDPRAGKRWGYETEFVLKRKDFGLAGSIPEKVIGEDIKVMLSVEATPKK